MSEEETKELTEFEIRALQIVRDHGPIKPKRFGKLMWPDSPGHHKVSGTAPMGSGMWRAAGGHLGRLAHEGLVERQTAYRWDQGSVDRGYTLTEDGREALEEAEADEEKKAKEK